MTNAQMKAMMDQMAAQLAAVTAQLAQAQAAPKAKQYEAGVVFEGEDVKVPKGHIAVVIPLLATPKALKNGKDQYIAETFRSVEALHKATGEGFSVSAYVIKRNSGHKL